MELAFAPAIQLKGTRPAKSGLQKFQPKRAKYGAATFQCSIKRPERYVSNDWARNLGSLLKSSVLGRVRSHLGWNFMVTVGIYFAYKSYPSFPIFHMSPVPHQLLGTAVSLLLVFRTNAAYDRFWEGRKLWGTVVNRMRNLSTLSLVNVGNPVIKDRIILFSALFPYLLKEHLEGAVEIEELPVVVDEDDRQRICAAGRRPLECCVMLREEVKMSFLEPSTKRPNEFVRISMEEDVTTMVDVMGACERIINTPVPLSYSRHTSRFLSVWTFTLPLVLVEKEDFLVIFSVLMITWALFCIEEIGHMVEDPFSGKLGSLPLGNYANTIRADCEELAGRSFLPKTPAATS